MSFIQIVEDFVLNVLSQFYLLFGKKRPYIFLCYRLVISLRIFRNNVFRLYSSEFIKEPK